MKNRFLIATILSTVLLFVSCGFNNDAKNEKTTGKVRVSFSKGGSGKSARTITSIGSYDISTFDWTVEFTNKATAETIEMNGGDVEINLPPAAYIAKATADYTEASGVVHHFYGETEFTVEVGEETDILIKVGLKKSATGKGTIGEITIDLTNVKDELSSQEGDITAAITPTADTESVTLDVEVSEDGNTATLTTDAELTSGYYYLEVKYPDETNVSISDFLVEISDGAETNGSLKAYATGLKRTYWAATNEGDDVPGEIGGGLSPSDKILFADVIDVLETGIEYWNEAEVYMTNDPEWDFTNYTISKPVTFIITKGENVGKYSVYYDGQDVIVTMEDGASELKVVNGNPKINESEGNLSHITIKNGATFRIASAGDRTVELSFDETNTDIDSLYSEKAFAVVESGNITFTLIKTEQAAAYTVVAETSGTTKSYHVVKTGSVDVSLNSLPEFKLNGISSEVMFAAGDIEVTAVPVTDGESFGDDILFNWKINGKDLTGTENTISFDPTKLMVPFNLSGVNVITCEVSNEAGNLRGTVSVEFSFVGDPGIILWNNTTREEKILKSNATETVDLMGSFGMQSFNGDSIKAGTASVTSSFLKSNVDSIIDFCFDTKGNIYVIHGNYDNKYLQKYDGITKNCILDKEITDLSYCSCENRKSSAYLNNYVYLLMNGKVYQIGMDGSAVELYISESSISALASDGNDLYAAFTSLGEDQDNDLKIGKVIISDEVISFESECLVIDKVVDEMNSTATYKNGWNNEVIGTSGKYENNFTITDIQVKSNKIFALFVEQGDTTGICRGGLLNLNIVSDSISFAPVKGTEYILGWDTISYPYTDPIYEEHSITNPLLATSFQSANLFYGPRKFIAIKPDELWIADEGIFVFEYSNGGYSYKDRKQNNRVISVSLNDMSMTTSEVDAMFTCTTDSNCGFKYY